MSMGASLGWISHMEEYNAGAMCRSTTIIKSKRDDQG